MNKYKVDINKEYSLLIKQAELPSVVSIEGLSQPMTEVALYILESGGYQERSGITVAESGYDLSIAGEVFVKPAAGYVKIVADKEYRLGVGLLPTTVGSANQDSFVQEIIETVMKIISPKLDEKAATTAVAEMIEDSSGVTISKGDIPVEERRKPGAYFIVDDFREIGTGYPGRITTGNLRLSRRVDE